MKEKNKKAQEEMVGFALIIILVAVITLVFLGFSLRGPQKENVEDYEAESFLQSMLQYTTKCESNIERLSIKEVIFSCYTNENCLDGKKSCEVLESDISKILSESWKIGDERPVKGYEFKISTDSDETILEIKSGEVAGSLKGSFQDFVKGNTLINIEFKAYY